MNCLRANPLLAAASAERVGIHERIGRRPIAALGNSDGDFEMLARTRPPRAAGQR